MDALLAGVCVRLRLRGADTSTSLHTGVTHVITDIHDEAKMDRIKVSELYIGSVTSSRDSLSS